MAQVVVVFSVLLAQIGAERVVKAQRGSLSPESTLLPNSFGNFKKVGPVGGGGGKSFDHWMTSGAAGAITQICVRSGHRLDRIMVSYGGRRLESGGTAGSESCFNVLAEQGEVITRVSINHGARVDAVKFKTSLGRESPRYGREGGSWTHFNAPAGQHLMSFHGRFGWEIDSLGVYWGGATATARWNAINHCVNCGSRTVTIEKCSKRTSTTSDQISSSWKVGASAEMGAAYNFTGPWSASGKITISGEWAETTVRTTSQGLETSTCMTTPVPCADEYIWQWTMYSNFDGLGEIASGSTYVCTNQSKPCCLPGTFSTDPAICDRDASAPNVCR